MAKLGVRAQKKSFAAPDDVRKFEKGKAEVVTLGEFAIGLGTFEPAWKWSTSVKPIAQTKSCEVEHGGYVLSGRMRIAMDDGTEFDIGPGDVFTIPPGHDAWTLGNEACKLVDFVGFRDYAKPK